MKELRCLVFTDQEVVKAVLDRRRRMKEPLPSGTVGTVTYRPGQPGGGVETLIQVTGDEGDDRSMTLHESEVAAALVSYCMGRKIPLPVESDKMLHLINGALTLMITMNFKKPPRLVEDRVEATEPPPAPPPVPRKAASRR
ncbi:hypothetical protein [Azospirillum argentinense]|uniref:Uncharacterized protein n=1 Tax=Azospirillum argentinense TaxID=2970906 RepID=A0ABW8VCM2_9PROT